MSFRNGKKGAFFYYQKKGIEKIYVNAMIRLTKNQGGTIIMKRRKMLISISLLIIMFLNSIMPMFVVNAAEGDTGVENGGAQGATLTTVDLNRNSKLYNAIKESLLDQNVVFRYDDIKHTLEISSIESITTLNLNEHEISDLTELDKFTGLKKIDLSGNNLTEESNLTVLNNLPNLEDLDLSTNQIKDISSIETLIFGNPESGTQGLKDKDHGINLSGQTIFEVNKEWVDTSEVSDNKTTKEFELPQILKYAGIIKPQWKSTTYISEEDNNITPIIKDVDDPGVPMIVTDEDNKVTVQISSEEGQPYLGLAHLQIYIYDSPSEARNVGNINPAGTNILKGSVFDLYYVIYADYEEAITTPDDNLYRAIKEQLTGGQEINKELSSYPYAVDENGEVIYEDFFYDAYSDSHSDHCYHLYKDRDSSNNPIYLYRLYYDEGLIYNDSPYSPYSSGYQYEKTYINVTDTTGKVTTYEGFRVPSKGNDETGKDLYVKAYDDAKTFVIEDEVLINKITSLELNNKKIKDLSGIEDFVGLTSTLNVSHNYLEDIKPLLRIDDRKDTFQALTVQKYNEWLSGRGFGSLSSVRNKIENLRNKINTDEQDIKNKVNEISTILKEAGKQEGWDSDQQSEAVANVNKKLKEINGYDDPDDPTKHIDGLIEILDKDLAELNTLINDTGSYSIYDYLNILYQYYNNEYRLTTLLCNSLNYISMDEYETYVSKTTGPDSTQSTAMELLNDEVSYITGLESKGALSDLDKELIKAGINSITSIPDYTPDANDKTPLNTYFNDNDTGLLKTTALSKSQIVTILKKFREISIYSEMASYCLIQRMNNTTVNGYCYEEEYLNKKIKELELDNIPTDMESTILRIVRDEAIATTLYNEYKANKTAHSYTRESGTGNPLSIYLCEGPYKKLKEYVAEATNTSGTPITSSVYGGAVGRRIAYYNNATYVNKVIERAAADGETGFNSTRMQNIINGMNIYDEIYFYERVKEANVLYRGVDDKLLLLDQIMSLATKLVNGDISRYVYLPRLKKLDISYNAELEDIGSVTALKDTLIDLNASYCYIADIDNVDWPSMTKLRRLNLGYNFISDIAATSQNSGDSKSLISMMQNLHYLNLSNNLLSGTLQITNINFRNILRAKNLKELDLSGNQLTDVQGLVDALSYVSGGDFGRYLAREDTIYVDLRNQNIVLDIEKPISLKEKPSTVDIDLPRIFNQLIEIDTERTAFGETSQNGRIENEGSYVTLNTRSVGDKTGVVVVKAMSGNGQDVATCVGEGTTATINYSVVEEILKLVGIEVTTLPKTEYFEGQVFDPEGMVVTATYTNGSEESTKEVTGYNIIDADKVLTLEDNKVKITYTEENIANDSYTQETTIDIVVSPSAEKEIKVTKLPNKTEYFEGQTFNPEGMEVTLYYDNGNTKVLTAEEYNIVYSEETLVLSESDKIIKVTYKVNDEKTLDDDFELTIKPVEMTGLRLIENPDKVNYVEGETFDKTGMVLKAYYSDGTEKDVTEESTVSPDRALEPTDKKVRVSYGGEEVVINVNVSEKTVLSSIEVLVSPKTKYVKGETFDRTGLVVLANYSNGSSKIVTNYTIADENKVLATTDTEVVITYKEDEIEKTATLPITVTETGTTPGNPTNHSTGDGLDIGYEKNEKSYLTNVKAKTPMSAFKDILLKDNKDIYGIQVVDSSGNQVTSGNMQTGMVVKVVDNSGNEVKGTDGNPISYTVIVKGDVNADGKVDAKDSIMIKARRMEVITLTDVQENAADIDSNNSVNAYDSKLVLYHRAEVSGYNLNYEN